MARDTGRVALAYVQGANPKARAHLSFAPDVIRTRLLGHWHRQSSMEISLDGLYRIDELADAFDRVLQTFRQNGVEETRNVLLYLNLYHDKRGVQWLDDDGNVIEHLKFDGPRERTFKADWP